MAWIVKLVPATLAPIWGFAVVELHVTPSLVPRLWSNIAKIWLLAVTAVVLTVTSVPAAGIITEPAAAAAQTAGPAEEEQLVSEPNSVDDTLPADVTRARIVVPLLACH